MNKSNIISQDNALTSARFEYTTLERNIFYSVLKVLSKEPKHKYIVSVADMQRATGVTNNYSKYTEATKQLLSRVYEIKEKDGNLLQVSMFSHCRYLKGQGLIEIGMSPEIHPYIFNLKNNFTHFQLDVALGLSSKFSKRMYEILSQWKTFNKGEKTFDLKELQLMLNIYDEKKDKGNYTWAMFEKRVLKVAQKDLNNKELNSDISFTYKGNKTGRKFVSITFKINTKSFQKTIDFEDDKARMYGVLVNNFQLNKKQAEKVFTQYTDKEINLIIYQIKQDIRDNKIYKSVGGYCAKRFGV